MCYLPTAGRARTIEILFGLDGDTVHLHSGGGDSAQWVRSLRTKALVKVRLGTKTYPGTAQVVGRQRRGRKGAPTARWQIRRLGAGASASARGSVSSGAPCVVFDKCARSRSSRTVQWSEPDAVAGNGHVDSLFDALSTKNRLNNGGLRGRAGSTPALGTTRVERIAVLARLRQSRARHQTGARLRVQDSRNSTAPTWSSKNRQNSLTLPSESG